jgi:hypothetical protein
MLRLCVILQVFSDNWNSRWKNGRRCTPAYSKAVAILISGKQKQFWDHTSGNCIIAVLCVCVCVCGLSWTKSFRVVNTQKFVFWYCRLYVAYSGPPLWSSAQSSWLQIQRSRVWFRALPDFLRSSGSGTGSTQPREDNWGASWKESSCSGLGNRN